MDFPFVKEAISQLFSKSSCAMYPAVEAPAAPNYRGRIVFRADLCINCGMCERVCSGNAITTTSEKTDEGDRITRVFNLGSCTFCATCADFCSRHAIELTGDYHMVATNEEDLLVKGTFIKKPPVKKAAPAAAKSAGDAEEEEEEEIPACALAPRDDGKPVNDPSKCVYCTLCAKKCPAGALEVDRANKTWVCDYDKCVACGTCAEVCPKKAIIM